ncbi:hypothetical protein Gpo141_00001786 [Globisporangium polare]
MAPRAKAAAKQQQKAADGSAPVPPKAQQQQQQQQQQPPPQPPPQKRKRAAPVSTASTLQTKTLFASTRDELREIQTELEELAQDRRKLIDADASGRKAVLPLLPPSEKKSW